MRKGRAGRLGVISFMQWISQQQQGGSSHVQIGEIQTKPQETWGDVQDKGGRDKKFGGGEIGERYTGLPSRVQHL